MQFLPVRCASNHAIQSRSTPLKSLNFPQNLANLANLRKHEIDQSPMENWSKWVDSKFRYLKDLWDTNPSGKCINLAQPLKSGYSNMEVSPKLFVWKDRLSHSHNARYWSYCSLENEWGSWVRLVQPDRSKCVRHLSSPKLLGIMPPYIEWLSKVCGRRLETDRRPQTNGGECWKQTDESKRREVNGQERHTFWATGDGTLLVAGKWKT